MEMAGLLFRRDSELKSEVLNKFLPDNATLEDARRQAELVTDAFSVANRRLYETLVAEMGEEEASALFKRFERFLQQHV